MCFSDVFLDFFSKNLKKRYSLASRLSSEEETPSCSDMF